MSRADAISIGDFMLRLVGTVFLLLAVLQLQAGDESIKTLLCAGVAVAVFILAFLRYRYRV